MLSRYAASVLLNVSESANDLQATKAYAAHNHPLIQAANGLYKSNSDVAF
jgi:hypothetical protein